MKTKAGYHPFKAPLNETCTNVAIPVLFQHNRRVKTSAFLD
jgi:hypothetical protein